MRRVSRNFIGIILDRQLPQVTPRMRRVSRNHQQRRRVLFVQVTPRMRRVSRNGLGDGFDKEMKSHASHEACE